MSSEAGLGRVGRGARARKRLASAARLLLLVGWALAAIGYYGAWVAHETAALTLSGADMGEFVKFLPGVLDGSLQILRQLLYLPPFAVVVSAAVLVGSRRLGFPWLLRVLVLALAVPVSLQLLPPAWSVASLISPEFMAQTIALGICWLLLAGFWLWGRLPALLTGAISASLCLVAVALPAWQFLTAKPAIDTVYGAPPPVGWGFYLCMVGLLLVALGSMLLAFMRRPPSPSVWVGA